mgnify:CR=1 FL=1
MAFHLHRNGQSTVFELATLREMAKRGELPQDEYVYVDEKGEWIGAGQVRITLRISHIPHSVTRRLPAHTAIGGTAPDFACDTPAMKTG